MFREIRLTPFILFLLLLIVLLISIIYWSNQSMMLAEGLAPTGSNVSTESKVTTGTDELDQIDRLKPGEVSTNSVTYKYKDVNTSIKLSEKYSNPLTKLYGVNYFDPLNGNLVRFKTDKKDTNTNFGIINSVIIYDRNAYLNPMNTTLQDQITPSTIISTSNYKEYVRAGGSDCTIFYIPWLEKTFIHIIKNNGGLHLLSFLFDKNISGTNKQGCDYKEHSTNIVIRGGVHLSEDVKGVKDAGDINTVLKGSTIYKLSNNFSFNIKNGNITCRNTTYDRSGNIIVDPKKELNYVNNVNFDTWFIEDDYSKLVLVCFIYKQSTVILLIAESFSENGIPYEIINCKKFTPEGVDKEGKIIKTEDLKQSSSSDENDDDDDDDDDDNDPLTDYYKWFFKFNTEAGNGSFSDEYLLKTQVVPPVCPSLPVYAAAVSAASNNGAPINTTPFVPNNTTPFVPNNTTAFVNTSPVQAPFEKCGPDQNNRPDDLGPSLVNGKNIYSEKYFTYDKTQNDPEPALKYEYSKCIGTTFDDTKTYAGTNKSVKKFHFK